MKVMIVEDERPIRNFVRINLKRQGIVVVEAESGEEAMEAVEREKDIDIALLDIQLPAISGLDVCRMLRRSFPKMGIIMLTALTQEEDLVAALEMGADDYICKPFSPTELLARINALYRRLHPVAYEMGGQLQSGIFVLSAKERKLWKNGIEVELTPTEYALMKLFLEHADASLSRDDILNAVWGQDYTGEVKTVDVHMRRLRNKIEDDPSHPHWIHTVWGHGYKWSSQYEEH